jgi:hypothetical protein
MSGIIGDQRSCENGSYPKTDEPQKILSFMRLQGRYQSPQDRAISVCGNLWVRGARRLVRGGC